MPPTTCITLYAYAYAYAINESRFVTNNNHSLILSKNGSLQYKIQCTMYKIQYNEHKQVF